MTNFINGKAIRQKQQEIYQQTGNLLPVSEIVILLRQEGYVTNDGSLVNNG